MKPLLSIIYVYFNTPEEIVQSIKSIMSAVKKESIEIIIIDNASYKTIPQIIKKKKNIQIIINKKNVGYSSAINQGAKLSKGKYLLIVNPDTEFTRNSIHLLVEELKMNPRVGAIGPQLIGKDDKNQQSISRIPF